MGIVLIVSALTALILYCRKQLAPAIICLMIGFSIFFITTNRIYANFQLRSIKPLALKINALKKPGDEIVAYNRYYQDLPFYTRSHIILMGGGGEIAYGIAHDKDKQQWFIHQQQLWKMWQGKTRIFMVMEKGNYEKLRKKHPMVFLSETTRNVLVSNRK